jgi:hypothetical protein
LLFLLCKYVNKDRRSLWISLKLGMSAISA